MEKEIDRLYFEEMLTIREVAQKVGRSPFKVWHVLNSVNKRRRDTSEAMILSYEKKRRSMSLGETKSEGSDNGGSHFSNNV